jgi:hypothetical protein
MQRGRSGLVDKAMRAYTLLSPYCFYSLTHSLKHRFEALDHIGRIQCHWCVLRRLWHYQVPVLEFRDERQAVVHSPAVEVLIVVMLYQQFQQLFRLRLSVAERQPCQRRSYSAHVSLSISTVVCQTQSEGVH